MPANDEEKTDDALEVSCLWVSNHGSSGFTVEFDVTAPWDPIRFFDEFQLWQDGVEVDDGAPPRVSLDSDYCDWLSIPGYDGGTPLPYPGYNQYNPAFQFNIAGQYWYEEWSPDGLTPWGYWSTRASVDISLYVIVNSNGALYSMLAWAYDTDGDGYEVPVYYSAGGGSFETLP